MSKRIFYPDWKSLSIRWILAALLLGVALGTTGCRSSSNSLPKVPNPMASMPKMAMPKLSIPNPFKPKSAPPIVEGEGSAPVVTADTSPDAVSVQPGRAVSSPPAVVVADMPRVDVKKPGPATESDSATKSPDSEKPAVDTGWRPRSNVRRAENYDPSVTRTSYDEPVEEACPPGGVSIQMTDSGYPPAPAPASPIPAMPPEAFRGYPGDDYTQPGPVPGDPPGVPQWAPPGLERPWPAEEYLFDGGDKNRPVWVSRDWTVYGMDLEDTIAHFDTLDGRTETTASNRVALYAPRFAAVRKIDGMQVDERHLRMMQVEQPLHIRLAQEDAKVGTATQPIQPHGQIGAKSANLFRERLIGSGLENLQGMAMTNADMFLPYEGAYTARVGIDKQADKARLSEATNAALAWSIEEALGVILDDEAAQLKTNDRNAQEISVFTLPPGKSRLEIIKTASREDAKSGETVEFVLRFQNVGDQTIGNVTIMDNLTTRLEYIPGTATCTVDAEFFHGVNEGESLVLRWEIAEPLKVGASGLIRFQCRVR